VFWLTQLGSIAAIITTMRYMQLMKSRATRVIDDIGLLVIGCLFLGLSLPVWVTDLVRYNTHSSVLMARSLAHTVPIAATLLAQLTIFASMGGRNNAAR
jgi:hypothetical protein